MLTLQNLKDTGGFIASAPVKREIKFKLDDDQEVAGFIHVKRLSIGDYEKLFVLTPDEQSKTAHLISETVSLGENGEEKISFTDAYQLHPSLAASMLSAFNEVNKGQKKN